MCLSKPLPSSHVTRHEDLSLLGRYAVLLGTQF